MQNPTERPISNAPLTSDSIAPGHHPLWRLLLFGATAGLALAAYALWRPPAPMLWMKNTVHLGRDTNQIALTLDDSPHPLTTPLLLASLDHAGVKATFFSVGENLKLYPELAHRIVAKATRWATIRSRITI